VAGDWDGDGLDDIGAFRKSNRTFLLAGPDGHIVRSIRGSTTRHLPVVGNWDGDRTDDQAAVLPTP
jgi:hypothetical protein